MNVQAIVHYLNSQRRDCKAEHEISKAMYAVRSWYKAQLGETFRLKRQQVHYYSKEAWHWTDALREWAGPNLCDNQTVFVSFSVGPPWQGGAYGADVWGCGFSTPGRVGGYWNAQTNPTGLRGWLSHELGHAFGLGHTDPPADNIMWMGHATWPNTYFVDADKVKLLVIL